MVAITVAFALAMWATFTAIRDLPEEDPWRWDRIHELEGVAVVWVVLVGVLVWAWFRRKLAPGECVRPLPPVGLLTAMAVLTVGELLIGDPLSKLSTMVGGGAIAAAVWVAAAVLGVEGGAGDDAEPPAPTDGRATHEASGDPLASAGGVEGSNSAEAKSSDDVWDIELWSGPERAVLVIVALAAPLALAFYVYEHLPEGWADLVALPILGVGDLVVAGLLVFVYGNGRAVVRRRQRRSATSRVAMPDQSTAETSPVQDSLEPVASETAGSVPPVDKVSIAAFAGALIGAALIAIPLGIWGLVRVKSGNRRGRGLAVAALGISAAWLVLASALLLNSGVFGGVGGVAATDLSQGIPTAGALSPTTPPSASTPSLTPAPAPPPGALAKPREVYWERLKPTMCIRSLDDEGVKVTVLDCRSEHQGEVTARTALTGTEAWPGDGAIDFQAENRCRTAFTSYVGNDYNDSRLELDFWTVDEAGWDDGGRTLICLVFDPSEATITKALQDAGE